MENRLVLGGYFSGFGVTQALGSRRSTFFGDRSNPTGQAVSQNHKALAAMNQKPCISASQGRAGKNRI
jgi:hypothetical protein